MHYIVPVETKYSWDDPCQNGKRSFVKQQNKEQPRALSYSHWWEL